jgi:hypothetical protein
MIAIGPPDGTKKPIIFSGKYPSFFRKIPITRPNRRGPKNPADFGRKKSRAARTLKDFVKKTTWCREKIGPDYSGPPR